MESLNELFEEILHSEQNYTAKITELRNVNSLIEEAEKTLRDAESMSKSLYGEYLLKTQKMVDCNTDVQLCRTEYDSLECECELLKEEVEKLTEECDELKNVIETARQQFITAANEFSHNHDLCGNGVLHRKQKQEEQLQLLKEELGILENETDQLKTQQNKMDETLNELTIVQSELKKEQDNQKNLQQEIDNLKQFATELTQEKTLLINGSANDSEYQRIQQELDLCRNCPEEKDCIRLRKELQSLQREQYKKQMKYRNKTVPSSRFDTIMECDKELSKTRVSHRAVTDIEENRSGLQQQNGVMQSQYDSFELEEFDDEIEFDEYDLASIEAMENIEYDSIMRVEGNQSSNFISTSVLPSENEMRKVSKQFNTDLPSRSSGEMFNNKSTKVTRSDHCKHAFGDGSNAQQQSDCSHTKTPLHYRVRNTTSHHLQTPSSGSESGSRESQRGNRYKVVSLSNQRQRHQLLREQTKDSLKPLSSQPSKRVRFSS